jgi:uncharacterized damage-inducible protein DinB
VTAANPLARLNAHRAWANALHVEWAAAQSTRSASFASSPDGAYCLKMLSHVLRAEEAWLTRLRGAVPENKVWIEVPVAEMDALRAANDAGLEAALGEDPARVLVYSRFDGTPMESTVADILTHVCTHGMYHRGQVAARAAQAGLPKLPATDFIAFARQFP